MAGGVVLTVVWLVIILGWSGSVFAACRSALRPGRSRYRRRPMARTRRRRRGRRRPAGTAAAITAVGRGLDGRVRRQGAVPARQDVRRRAHRERAAAPRAARALARRAGSRRSRRSCARPCSSPRAAAGRAFPLPHDGAHAAVVSRRGCSTPRSSTSRRRRGVDVREGARGREAEAGRRRRRAHARRRRGARRAYVIAADGHWSTVRRALEPDAPRDLGEWHAVRQYFDGVDDDRLWVLFERDLLPGYAWVFPLPDGRANVGYGVLRVRRPQRSRAEGPVARPPGAAGRCATCSARRAQPTEPVHAWPIPTRYEPARLAHGRVLFVGRRGGRRRSDDRRGHRAGDRDRACSRPRRSRPAPTTARLVHRALGRDLRFATLLQRVLRRPLGARAAIARRPTSRRGPAATSPAGCGRTIPARCSARPTAGGAACSPRPGAVVDLTSGHASAKRHAMMSRWPKEKQKSRSIAAPTKCGSSCASSAGSTTWMPGVETCVVDGDVRTIGMMGIEIKEQLRDLDDDGAHASRTR